MNSEEGHETCSNVNYLTEEQTKQLIDLLIQSRNGGEVSDEEIITLIRKANEAACAWVALQLALKGKANVDVSGDTVVIVSHRYSHAENMIQSAFAA